MTREELIPFIHTHDNLDDAIPYVTSYYNKTWGFCISKNDLMTLPKGRYKVHIDTKHVDGHLSLLEAKIPGKSDEEIFFSSYLCHPSMANNELSGPVLLSQIMEYVKSIPDRQYTYRFVLLPETIGSIAYLSSRLETPKKMS